MNQLKQALLALWDSATNGTHLTTDEQGMIHQLRALGTTNEELQALTVLAAVGTTPELINTYARITSSGRITDENIAVLLAHGISERLTP